MFLIEIVTFKNDYLDSIYKVKLGSLGTLNSANAVRGLSKNYNAKISVTNFSTPRAKSCISQY